MKADLAPMTRFIGAGELANRGDDGGELFVVCTDLGIELGQLGRDGLVVYDQQTKTHKGADHVNAHLGRRVAGENVGGLNRTVLSEGVGEKTRITMLL